MFITDAFLTNGDLGSPTIHSHTQSAQLHPCVNHSKQRPAGGAESNTQRQIRQRKIASTDHLPIGTAHEQRQPTLQIHAGKTYAHSLRSGSLVRSTRMHASYQNGSMLAAINQSYCGRSGCARYFGPHVASQQIACVTKTVEAKFRT